ncbi:zinc finger, PMZ-type containing protein [Tanacetum coccineum]|uniref:Zinc finger, PMZ-type containing protein n=1 Tax=Tanacetum coccineum TaxID=301880 RepID=A0ABQ4YML2_9ASTR
MAATIIRFREAGAWSEENRLGKSKEASRLVGDFKEMNPIRHRKYTRHVHANFKKKYSGLQLQRLFWGAASSTVEELFYAKMDDLKNWYVFLSAYEDMEVRCGDQAYAVNLSSRTCSCRLWQLSGVPYIHAVAGYMHLNRDPDEGVHFSYSQDVWARTYQHFIRTVPGTNLWKRTNNRPPLPPIVRKMPGRPRKKRVKAAVENNSQVTRLGKKIRCFNCRRREPNVQYASARGRGRGSRGGGRGQMGAKSGGKGPMGAESGGKGQMGAESGGRGPMGAESDGKGGRVVELEDEVAGGMWKDERGGGRGSTSGLKLMDEDDIRQSMEDEYMQGLLDEQEDLRKKQEKEHQI